MIVEGELSSKASCVVLTDASRVPDEGGEEGLLMRRGAGDLMRRRGGFASRSRPLRAGGMPAAEGEAAAAVGPTAVRSEKGPPWLGSRETSQTESLG